MDSRTKKNLAGVHPDLVKVIQEAQASSPIPFIVTEGLRTMERQKQLKAAGASRTLNSRHLTGHAVDVVCLVGGKAAWDWPLYDKLSKHIKKVATKLGVAIVWGGDWKKFRDGVHFELDKKVYPP